MVWGPGDQAGRRWLDVLLPAGLLAAFFALTLPFFDFFLDDAFITFRYAEHLAEGHGIVWNVGGDPVEGPTSMLWVFLNAIPAVFGLSLPAFAKGTGVPAGAVSIVVVYAYARRRGCDRPVATGAGATMALSAPFVLIALQGMETTVAALLALLATITALELVRSPHPTRYVSLAVLLLLAVLARPDLVVYGAGLLAATLWRLHERGTGEVPRAIAYLAAFLILPGLIYTAWRWAYFGYPLPNAFYIKQARSFKTFFYGAENVFGFLTVVLGPLVPLAGWRLVQDRDASQVLARLSPPLAAAGLFLPLWFLIAPVQGFMWRFQMPALAPLALTLALAVRELPTGQGLSLQGSDGWRDPQRWAAVLLVVLLVVFPLHSFRSVGDTQRYHSSQDRIAAGQALAPLEDTNATMFVTEAGAVPYYGGWEAVDLLGLNNETIAHEGLTVEFIEDFDPDLVMLRTPVRSGIADQKWPTLGEFVRENDYRLTAVIEKSLHPNDVHLYFVDPSSPHAGEISCQLLTIESVTYADRVETRDFLEFPVDTVGDTRQSCRGGDA